MSENPTHGSYMQHPGVLGFVPEGPGCSPVCRKPRPGLGFHDLVHSNCMFLYLPSQPTNKCGIGLQGGLGSGAISANEANSSRLLVCDLFLFFRGGPVLISVARYVIIVQARTSQAVMPIGPLGFHTRL